ncbi:hypothetical protein BFP97_03425 [Roseivirga sp. 4D4]|uniref:avidin/streptavidin family protein n=1 Tax=Roseivirga sp. 4D4 TaxID=1889784 RepID=UPI000852D340|nr:avidin/streptavidin family protein [Roseivirga sp. 4D4]OEK00612.1 hypothetical protein BFP97_03425 [Roseivirga sp. 4D4]
METTQNVGLVGSWKNSYGSLMKISSQSESGFISGTYSSTTGASGTYALVGYAPVGISGNYPVSISIYWRSLDGGQSNPTWNWVSQMSGQVLTDSTSGTTEIELLHGMVASTPYSAVGVPEPGVYTETLVFTPYDSSENRKESTALIESNDSLAGNWVNKNSAAQLQSLQLTVDQFSVTGLLQSTSSTNNLAGLYDYTATQDMLLSVSLTALLDNESSVSLGGFLNQSLNELTLLTYKSHGTTYGNKYASVNVVGTDVFNQV